jgi:ATP phosphoribosyltransferase regulatory subunit
MIDRKETEPINDFLKPYAVEASREAFCKLTTLAGKREIIAEARLLVTNEKSSAALDNLERVYVIAEELGMDTHIDIDLGDVGGLDYYTGLTFKIYTQGLGAALGRGGRYDRLLENFGASEPAVGFSLCLDWLAQLLASKLKERIEAQIEEAVELKTDGDVVAAFKEATRLRSKGRKITVNSE